MNIPYPSTHVTSLRPRGTGPLFRPHMRTGTGQWNWTKSPERGKSPIIAEGDPLFNDDIHLSRKTPTGLTEAELLASFNYLDSEALLSFHGIGPALAANIQEHRLKSRYFATLDELAMVPKIGAKRFAKLTGRAPQTGRYRLHDLMRRSRSEDIRMSDLQPWTSPSPGIAAIYVMPHQSAFPEPPAAHELVVRRLRRYSIHFHCNEHVPGGRASFLLKNLSDVLRRHLP